MPQLYALNKAHPRRLVRVAGINDLDGMAIVNGLKYYAALGSDLGVVRPRSAHCAAGHNVTGRWYPQQPRWCCDPASA